METLLTVDNYTLVLDFYEARADGSCAGLNFILFKDGVEVSDREFSRKIEDLYHSIENKAELTARFREEINWFDYRTK